jgi:SAM-dependent methyltransferase
MKIVSNSVLNYLRQQSFQPDAFSIFLNPFFLIRLSLFRKIKSLSENITGKTLDFGCGRKPYRNIFRVSDYIGVDIEYSGHDHSNSLVDVFYDGSTIPFENDHFDSVVCFEVIEHIFNPDEMLTEISRVLKKDGIGLFSVPFCWNEHEIPFDYARYSSFGIRHLLEKNGFEILELHKTGSYLLVIVQLIILFVFQSFERFGRIGLVFGLIFYVPLNILGLFLGLFQTRDSTLYFNTVILVRKK